MKVYENQKYREDIQYVAELKLPWEKLEQKSILISGASGFLGSCLVDVLMYRNREKKMGCKVYVLGRDADKTKERFKYCWEENYFQFFHHDINFPLSNYSFDNIDYIIHLASNTHPIAYASDPIGTITTNIIGLYHLLEFATKQKTIRVAFASSNEIYGENRGDVETFYEDYCGYINSNTVRAGYPESKRCGEALCQAYRKQKDLNIVIPRLTRSYGPTMLKTDTKAISQFIQKAVSGEDIVLKSKGMQYYSYTYVTDAVSGLLTVLFHGNDGEAYNIADCNSDIMLKDLAAMIAKSVGRNIIFELPDEIESLGYSKATKARLDSQKLQKLGWKAQYNIESGVKRTISILKELSENQII